MGAYAIPCPAGQTTMVPLPPCKGTGGIKFGPVFVSLASDFDGAVCRVAIGDGRTSFRVFENVLIESGRRIGWEAIPNVDSVCSVVNRGPQNVSALVEYGPYRP